MATSGEGILALIGGTRLRKKKERGRGFPILEKWIDVSVLDFYYGGRILNSRGFEPATIVAGPAALTY